MRYPDQEFMRKHQEQYDRYVGRDSWDDSTPPDARFDDPKPLTDEELHECWELLWMDDPKLVGDHRLARDHDPVFVYSLAVRLLEERLGL